MNSMIYFSWEANTKWYWSRCCRPSKTVHSCTDTQNCRLRKRQECRERFSHHRLQKKPLVSDPGMHHGVCVTQVPWCMSESLNSGGRGKVPGFPGACGIRNFAYLVWGQCNRYTISGDTCCIIVCVNTCTHKVEPEPDSLLYDLEWLENRVINACVWRYGIPDLHWLVLHCSVVVISSVLIRKLWTVCPHSAGFITKRSTAQQRLRKQISRYLEELILKFIQYLQA